MGPVIYALSVSVRKVNGGQMEKQKVKLRNVSGGLEKDIDISSSFNSLCMLILIL